MFPQEKIKSHRQAKSSHAILRCKPQRKECGAFGGQECRGGQRALGHTLTARATSRKQLQRQPLSCDTLKVEGSHAGSPLAGANTDPRAKTRNRNPQGSEPRGPKHSDDTVTFQEIASHSASEFYTVTCILLGAGSPFMHREDRAEEAKASPCRKQLIFNLVPALLESDSQKCALLSILRRSSILFLTHSTNLY